MNYQPPPQMYKNAGLAAVLSFFYMGLGQIYNGQIGKGVFFIILYTISWFLCLVIVGFLTTPIMWVWGMYDAYKTSEKINLELSQTAGRQQGPAGG